MSSAVVKSSDLTGRMRNLTNMHKPVIDISLSSEVNSQSRFVTSLCTLDSLAGTARITAPSDLRFDSVEIALNGTSRTLVDRMSPASAVPKAQHAIHKFIDLRQPNTEERLPEDKMLRAGIVYNIPFNFVVLDRMPVNLCRHKVKNAKVRERHHALPPSLGDPEVSGTGKTLLDDMSPKMCRIVYAISVRIMQRRSSDGRQSTLAEKSRKLRIVPATEEQPPLGTDDRDDDYCLYEEKKIKQGLLGRTTGTVSAQVRQPQSFVLPAIEAKDSSPVTSASTVMLRFDPSTADMQPPRLDRLSTKLKASTFFASIPMSEFPSSAKQVYDYSQGLYAETMNLNCRNMESVQWTKHEPSAVRDFQPVRQDSAVSFASTASVECRKPFYTAQFIVPTTLPTNKSFVPSFHSCLISRTYALDFSLNFSSQSRGPSLFNNIDLRVPVQITAAPSSQHLARRASYMAEIEEQYEDYDIPRSATLPLIHGMPTLLAAHEGLPAYAPHGPDKDPLPLYS